VIWVDADCGPCGEGTETTPYETITGAFGATRDTREATLNVIRVAAGSYEESGYVYRQDSRPLAVVGEGDVLWLSRAKTLLNVSGATAVTLRNLKLRGVDRAVYCVESAVCVFEDVIVDSFSHEGLKVDDNASAVLDRCLVRGNGKVGLRAEGHAEIATVNTMFVHNGMGMHLTGADVELEATNCTFSDNHTEAAPGAIKSMTSSMSLRGLVIWNNSTAGDVVCELCTLGEDTSIGVDPRFSIDVAGDRWDAEDYEIGADSPARNLVPTAVGIPDLDYFGVLRDSADGFIDAGADEYLRD